MLHFADDVVVQLQLLKLVKTCKVVDLDNVWARVREWAVTFVGEGKVGQLPEGHAVVVIDLVVLIVLNEILPGAQKVRFVGILT